MANRSETPLIAFAAALLLFFTGGFLLLLDVGRNSRESERLHFEPGAGGAAPAEASTYFGDVEKGGEIIKEKAETFLDDIFSGGGKQPSAARRTKTARSRPEDAVPSGDPEGDAFEKYFKKNYAKLFDEESAPSSGSGDGSYGGGSAAGGGRDGAAIKNSSREGPQKGAAAGNVPTGAAASAPGPRPVFGGPASNGAAAAPRNYASLPAGGAPLNNSANSGSPAGTAGGSTDYGGGKLQKDGGLSGFPGKGAGGAVGGGAESARAGAQSNYNSKMSGGAAAAKAAASGSSTPEVSKPAKAETDKKAAKTVREPRAEADSGDQPSTDDPSGSAAVANDPVAVANEAPDLVKSVVADKLNGKDQKLVSVDDAAIAPEEALLKPGAIAGGADETAVSEPDPEDLASLPAERQAALKKEIHVFLKQVESKYGAMADITYSSCSSFPDVCKAHGLTANYLTMKMTKGATLVMGVKYVKGKWRRYTLDFKDPSGVPVQPASNDNADNTDQGQ